MSKKITKQQIVDYWETRKYEGDMGTDWDTATEACWCCGKFTKNLEKCHIVAKMLGGEDKVSNYVLLCKSCHRDSPDFDNPDYMWDWIKNNSEFCYEYFYLKKVLGEYKKMFGELPMLSDEESKNVSEIMADIQKKKAGFQGGSKGYSTMACVLKEAIDSTKVKGGIV